MPLGSMSPHAPARRTREWAAVLVLSLLAVASGCGPAALAPAGAPAAAFGTGEVWIASGAKTFVVPVEVAATDLQHRTGLRERTELPEDQGMLFLFPEAQPADISFWMYRTPIPLSVALLDEEGVIRAILDLEPCLSWIALFCRRYPAGVPFHAALEVNRGYFARRGIAPGDRVILTADPVDPRPGRGVP